MKLISSPPSSYGRKFAIAWMAFMGIFTVLVAFATNFNILKIILVSILPIAGAHFFKRTTWDVVDEAEDYGEYLLFKKGEKHQKVNINDIVKLDHPFENFKGLIRVHLQESGEIGRTITFRAISSDESRFTPTELFRNLSRRCVNAINP